MRFEAVDVHAEVDGHAERHTRVCNGRQSRVSFSAQIREWGYAHKESLASDFRKHTRVRQERAVPKVE